MTHVDAKLVIACALALAACAPSERGAQRAGRESDAQAAQRLLEDAASARVVLYASSPEERDAARQRAVEAYRAVYRRAPGEREAAAEAAFRAGELLRAGGRFEEALAELARAREYAGDGTFAARALLEVGHVHRRSGRADEALAAYERLIADARADAPCREQAAWWSARVQAERGRAEEARRIWERLAREGEEPLMRIRAFDAWIESLVAERALEEAAGVLELCRASLRASASEASELGLRVSAALERMSGPTQLARAVAERACPQREPATGTDPRFDARERVLRPQRDGSLHRRPPSPPPPPPSWP